MPPIFPILAGILGILLANLVSLQGARMPLNGRRAFWRSYCPHCPAVWSRLRRLPIVWYISAWGKCPYCRGSLPIGRFVWELCGGLFSISLMFWFGPGVEFYRHLALAVFIAWELSLIWAEVPPSWGFIAWAGSCLTLFTYLGALNLPLAIVGGVLLLSARIFASRSEFSHWLAISGLLVGFLGLFELFLALLFTLPIDWAVRVRYRVLLSKVYAAVALGAVILSGPAKELLEWL